MRLYELRPNQYAGYSYEQASRRAQEVCAIAAQTGQTILAAEHLSDLVEIMQAMKRAA